MFKNYYKGALKQKLDLRPYGQMKSYGDPNKVRGANNRYWMPYDKYIENNKGQYKKNNAGQPLATKNY
jgi:hypothetical protein